MLPSATSKNINMVQRQAKTLKHPSQFVDQVGTKHQMHPTNVSTIFVNDKIVELPNRCRPSGHLFQEASQEAVLMQGQNHCLPLGFEN